ncbi:polyhydroxyalkanoate depolymerase [Sphingobium lignivorans]|uniref:Poly(3-hydroxybutyrate) depolymerase n=1 Tax=Sphingobium lignivorans TaxID=2735886 RepID=A0ABR6NEL2_9SPHN|nr:polyhydroxyalkanoate depolymerase [Sphingobium lignivorans]MBB5985506.1 poly(3-hydroxybutyrate) depolymerase [Sphingobium lignivorans]
MLYNAYEIQRSLLASASAMATASVELLQNPANPFAYFGGGPMLASALDVFAHAAAPRGKPAFDLPTTEVNGKTVPVREVVEARKTFGQLKHFIREGHETGSPKVLIVAPMSGHFATLLRGTVARLMPAHDVYITDWRDARNVPLSQGGFDLDDYVDYLIDWLDHIGPGAHMLAVCQPSVPCLAAASLMSAADHPARPRTLTMMGGPIDTRQGPTAVNELAQERPLSWFRQNVVATVPFSYPGAGRKVYPGFMQLAGFMSMNLGNHLMSHWQMFRHLVKGDEESAEATKRFYDEYRSVCDMTAEFYLQTVNEVFKKHSLPKGEFMHRGAVVDTGAIRDIALLAVEGENDDISGIGQTEAALHITPNLPDAMKQYYLARDVGHYGIFNGSKWRNRIAPVVEAWIAQHDRSTRN